MDLSHGGEGLTHPQNFDENGNWKAMQMDVEYLRVYHGNRQHQKRWETNGRRSSDAAQQSQTTIPTQLLFTAFVAREDVEQFIIVSTIVFDEFNIDATVIE